MYLRSFYYLLLLNALISLTKQVNAELIIYPPTIEGLLPDSHGRDR